MLITNMYVVSVRGLMIDRSKEELETVPRDIDIDVTQLTLDNNILFTLDASSFDLYLQMTEISMKSCKTKYIKDGTFDNQDKLISVDFKYCSIVLLPSSFGPSTLTLTYFGIQSGYETTDIFTYPYFAAFQNLQELDIGGSMLMDLDPTNYPLILPNSLIKIVIDYGDLPSFPNIGHLVPQLEMLSVSNNNIPVIPQESIANLIGLRKFYANENRLETIPNLSDLKKLKTLNIKTNGITHLSREHIKGLTGLAYLGANRNKIVPMPNVSGLEQIVSLRLEDNLIRYVPASCLYGLTKLNNLVMYNNRITFIEDISQPIKTINLHDNLLRTPPDLYESTFDTLTLEQNLWVCNQSMCWLRMWPFNKPIPQLDNFVCWAPGDLNGTLVMQVHPILLKCYEGKRTQTVISHKSPSDYTTTLIHMQL